MKTLLIAGGSGFLEQVLEQFFLKMKYRVKILTRSPKRKNDIFWNAKDLGTWTELVLKSRNVVPKRLLNNGFKFKYAQLNLALTDLIKN